MKALIVYLCILSIYMFGCNSNHPDHDISGVYVNKSQSEYSVAFDTLILSKKAATNYEVERKTGFQKIRNGSTMLKEFKSEKWPAQFNQEKMLLSETELGRQISVEQNGKSINLKSTSYSKIK
jgi:hypothetical protein